VKTEISLPRVLLGTRSLQGMTYATRDRLLDVTGRYREPESLAVTISRALDASADGVLASPSPLLATAIEKLKRPVPLYVVIPALTEQERLELVPGIEPLLKRAKAGAQASGVRTALARVTHPAAIYGGDWATRLPVLVESELAALTAGDLRGIVLDAWLTDIALATENRKMFETFVRFVRSRFHVAAAFETHNLGLLLPRLKEWEVTPDFVLAPVNANGLGMKPSPEEALAELRTSSAPVIAKELCAGGPAVLGDAVRFARECGAAGVAPDLCEVGDAGLEFRALRI